MNDSLFFLIVLIAVGGVWYQQLVLYVEIKETHASAVSFIHHVSSVRNFFHLFFDEGSIS